MRSLALLACLVTPMSAQSPGESHDLKALTARLQESGGRWVSFLNRPSLSCGVYRLPKGAKDGQSPHALDEVYYVISGKAALEVEGKRHDAHAGAVLFVAAGAQHRFVDIEADLTTLVFFSESRATRGGMAAGPRPTEQTPYDEASERGSARIFYWFGDSSAGQLEIVHGRPVWKGEGYEKFMAKPSATRWRFGENFWTTLDTNIPVTIGGAELDVGLYYLVLQNHPDAGLRLLALDAQEVRKQRLDAYEANETSGGIAIPLQHERTSGMTRRLTVDLEVDRSEKHLGKLTVRFGPHVLRADVVMKP